MEKSNNPPVERRSVNNLYFRNYKRTQRIYKIVVNEDGQLERKLRAEFLADANKNLKLDVA